MQATTPQSEQAGQPPVLALAPGSALTDDDCMHCLVMYQTVMGGGVAPVGHDEAKRLEKLGLVTLHPATDADIVAGEILPEYTFTMTPAGEKVARDYRSSWQNV